MYSERGNLKEILSYGNCHKGCQGRVHLFLSQPLLAVGLSFVKRDSSNYWDEAIAELRGATVVFYKLNSYNETDHIETCDLVAVASLHMYRVDFVQRDDVFRVYFTPICKKCGVYSYIQPGDDEVDDWRSGLARARASKIVTPGDLRVFSRIGEGGYGKVYVVSLKKPQQISNVTSEFSDSADASFRETREVEVGDVFALKVIPKTEVFHSCTTFRHLAAERATLERAKGHPYLMHLSFAFQTRDHLFLGMPLCAGGDLVSYTNRFSPPRFRFPRWHQNCCGRYFDRPRLPEDSVRRIAAQVIVALQTLHSWGALYRDVKPENIFIDADGNVLLGDFGLVRNLRSASDDGAHVGPSEASTDCMTVCGTEVCMAPEVFTGKYSYEADVWSFGITIYRLLTGRHPFPSRGGLPSQPTAPRNQSTLTFPCFVSRAARSFLRKILTNSPETRPSLAKLKAHRFFRRMDWTAVRDKRVVALPDVPGLLKARGPFAGAKMAMTGSEWRMLNRKSVTEEDCWTGREAGARDERIVPGFEFGVHTRRYKSFPVVGQYGVLGGGWVRGWRGVEELPLEVRLFLYS